MISGKFPNLSESRCLLQEEVIPEPGAQSAWLLSLYLSILLRVDFQVPPDLVFSPGSHPDSHPYTDSFFCQDWSLALCISCRAGSLRYPVSLALSTVLTFPAQGL